MIFATENRRFSNVIKKELWPETAYCREVVTANETAVKAYVPGTVLGRVTATGKYKISVVGAGDGSQVAAAIVLEEKAVAAATDTKVLVMVKGPSEVSKFGLILDASYDLDAEKDAAYAALEAKGINVLNAV